MQTKEEGNGRVFLAKVKKLSAMPESEMAEVRTFDELPEKLTYPAITPTLFERKKQGIGKRLLYGTGNPAKLSLMRKNLEQLQIEIVGLSDIDVAVPQADEDGDSPLENARKKAKCYYEAFQIPVFSCDTGLYFENVPEDKQPGVHVRRVNGKICQTRKCLHITADLLQSMVVCMHTTAMPSVLSWMRNIFMSRWMKRSRANHF